MVAYAVVEPQALDRLEPPGEEGGRGGEGREGEVAPQAKEYVGLDFSPGVLEWLKGVLAQSGYGSVVTLIERQAEDLSGLEAGRFDTVIINSVAQYFPHIDYLVRVLEGAIERVRAGGAVFVGDVRSLPLLEAFHASVELARAEGPCTREELRQRVRARLMAENELVIDPGFFLALKQRLPRISHVEIRPKRAKADNELSKFRYDVSLHIEKKVQGVGEVRWLDWDKEELSLEHVRRHLKEDQPASVGLRAVPNERVSREVQILEWLSKETGGQREAWEEECSGIDPSEFWALGNELPYAVDISWVQGQGDGRYDVVFWRGSPEAEMARGLFPIGQVVSRPWTVYANNPLAKKLTAELIPELRAFLQEKLPEYMMPAAYVFLDALPLTPNGKVNRKALPAPEGGRSALGQAYEGPHTRTEEILAEKWSAVLGIERIGIHDNFFELGGHSLLATQVVSRIRQAFEVDLPLRALFETPTVAGLAEAIERSREARLGLRAPPIQAVLRDRELPLSFAQERLWFLAQLVPDDPFYNMPGALRLRGNLDTRALAGSMNAIVARHEALRTAFVSLEGRAVQVIAPSLTLDLPVVDLSDMAADGREVRARELAMEEAQRPFDLSQKPLLRMHLVRMADDDHVLIYNMHHIVSDGWSVGIFVEELAALYPAFVAGEPSPLAPLPIQYADFSQWQRQWVQGEVLEEQLAYWKGQLAGLPEVLALPTDHPRPAVQSYRGANCPVRVSVEVAEGLRALSREAGGTLFMTLSAAFQVLLHRYTGQTDFAVGSPIANRNRAEIERLIGFFVNTLVLRADLSGNPTFEELLDRVKEVTLGAYAHQDLPFERLVEELKPERTMSHLPLVQVCLALQNAPMRALELPELEITPWEFDPGTTRFELVLHLWEQDGGGLWGLLEYNTDLFEAATARRMVDHLQVLLEGVLRHRWRRISDLPLLKDSEYRQLVVGWNATRRVFPQDQCIHQLFEAQVEENPGATAVVFEEQALTYAELNARANQLGHHLRGLGVGPDVLVAICVERSLEMVVGLLGILKAGGAYVPLDPDYPRERLVFMLQDSQAPVLLTQERLLATLPETQLQVFCLDRDWGRMAKTSDARLVARVKPENIAYVIYTSGSTGRPKGVVISHRAIGNHMLWMQAAFPLSETDKVLQKTPFSFDASVWEFYAPLLAGAQLVVASPGGHQDPHYLAEVIAKQHVTTLQVVPSLLQLLLDEEVVERFSPLRRLFCGGEALPLALQQRFFACHEGELHNLYGPTEAATDVTSWRCEPDSERPTAPIGRPIANTQVYILDRKLNPVPIGVAGELHIGGAGLARGYLNGPALTAEKFIPHPLSEEEGARLYKTGDSARYLPDGNIEFLGRIDHQVKVRGFRIELGEIESTLAQYPAVREAVVLAREDSPGDKRLVAYAVVEPQALDRLEPASGLQGEQVALWRTLYEDTYGQRRTPEDPAFDITGWNSSYTGQKIPAAEMREWVEETVARLQALDPQRVLEIGCGTGLLLLRLAPKCVDYVGMDFSRAVLGQLGATLAELPYGSRVMLLERRADELTGLEGGRFDTVILNSVVQYFPHIDYLLRVLEGAIDRVKAGGRVFVGDVRSLPLLEAFHVSVEVARAEASCTRGELRQRVHTRLSAEKELVVDPVFFLALKERIPRISHVEIRPKRGKADNELSRFRYDVSLHLEAEVKAVGEVRWLDWRKERLSLAEVRAQLGREEPLCLGLRGVPNARVSREVQILEWLASETGPETIGEACKGWDAEVAGVDPQAFWALGEELAYAVDISWAQGQGDGRYEVVFWRGSPEAEMARGLFPIGQVVSRPWTVYANNPLTKKFTAELIPGIRAFLQEKLPEEHDAGGVCVSGCVAVDTQREGKPQSAASTGGSARVGTSL